VIGAGAFGRAEKADTIVHPLLKTVRERIEVTDYDMWN
jgi:hypothetical protein